MTSDHHTIGNGNTWKGLQLFPAGWIGSHYSPVSYGHPGRASDIRTEDAAHYRAGPSHRSICLGDTREAAGVHQRRLRLPARATRSREHCKGRRLRSAPPTNSREDEEIPSRNHGLDNLALTEPDRIRAIRSTTMAEESTDYELDAEPEGDEQDDQDRAHRGRRGGTRRRGRPGG